MNLWFLWIVYSFVLIYVILIGVLLLMKFNTLLIQYINLNFFWISSDLFYLVCCINLYYYLYIHHTNSIICKYNECLHHVILLWIFVNLIYWIIHKRIMFVCFWVFHFILLISVSFNKEMLNLLNSSTPFSLQLFIFILIILCITY